jgi:hypothetical protein
MAALVKGRKANNARALKLAEERFRGLKMIRLCPTSIWFGEITNENKGFWFSMASMCMHILRDINNILGTILVSSEF